ncbi:catalase family protein [Isosphaeraceae bacterium EP7]
MSFSILASICITLNAPVGGGESAPKPSQFEKVPAAEATQIGDVIGLTVEQQKMRYPGNKPVLRGVHPKDHGCVQATVEVLEALPENLRIGVFASPGRKYEAWIRFSNAAVLVGPDSPSSPSRHGSRGMAIKLMGVSGSPLLEVDGALTQDFLMVNHPVFAFSNVEDYGALSQVLLTDKDNPTRFFVERIRVKDGKPDLKDPITLRALNTKRISERIQSLKVDGDRGAYQDPPASPVDNIYFSAAPYLFGPDHVMKYSVKPENPQTGGPSDTSDPDYLRKALYERLAGNGAKDIVLDFRVQVRGKADLEGKIEHEIEDACTLWDEKEFPWATVAKITIKPQDFNTEDRKRQCEALFFTPWHGVADHQPIGGINRLKLGVYRASSAFRHFPKEPSGFDGR